jgi:hypothetical protein
VRASIGASSTSWPSIRAVPAVGARKPVTIFMHVDFPARSAQEADDFPRSTRKLTPRSARWFP